MSKYWRNFLIGCVLAVGAVGLRSTQNNEVQSAAPTPHQIEQCAAVTSDKDGTFFWTYPQPYAFGVQPIITAIGVAPAGSHEVVNVQLDGTPTNTQAKFRVTTTQGAKLPESVVLHVTARAP